MVRQKDDCQYLLVVHLGTTKNYNYDDGPQDQSTHRRKLRVLIPTLPRTPCRYWSWWKDDQGWNFPLKEVTQKPNSTPKGFKTSIGIGLEGRHQVLSPVLKVLRRTSS